VLDEGYPEFQPSNLEVTWIDVPNTATNVIPGAARARLNIRFNPTTPAQRSPTGSSTRPGGRRLPRHRSPSPADQRRGLPDRAGPFTDVVAAAVADVTGRRPELSTTGGTSDARFIRALCPVVEARPRRNTMHQVDERAPVAKSAAPGRLRRLIARYLPPCQPFELSASWVPESAHPSGPRPPPQRED
jgi:succinyl-diaminopimelate desuccinylase